jgi:hypothetical protein
MRRSIRINQNQDEEHLRLLAIFHYVLAGFHVFGGCFPLIYVVLGVAMMTGGFDGGRNPPPPMMGFFFAVFGAAITLFLWGFAFLKVLTGRWLTQHTHHRFCFVVACIECINMPLGTTLGIFTILVLSRPSVKALFDGLPPEDLRLDEFDDEDEERESEAAPSRKRDDGSVREGR